MPAYSKGLIYSIRFLDNDRLIYIGSIVHSLAEGLEDIEKIQLVLYINIFKKIIMGILNVAILNF